uniref:glutamate-1-semialdehyde 2,1-aminomutase n=1 Tax=Algoriphagus sp. TaxID=1872435 RepID=UPI0040477A50
MNYKEKLNSLIPGGAHTYSRGDDQYPSNAPAILEKGKGAYVWDPFGNKFLDYGMALRAVTLGYSYDSVNQAAFRGMEKGVNLTRASTIELEAAQTMVDLIPGAEMVKFAKNGSTVTTAAIKIARAYTSRKYVCVPKQQPFFSFDDWFIGTTPIKKGIPEEHYSTTLVFEYNNIQSLEVLFAKYERQIAAVIMEPATTLEPCTSSNCNAVKSIDHTCSSCLENSNNFLQKVQKLCNSNGTVFIIDEMITGFRWHLQGAQTYFNIQPDLSTFGKGMANGFAVSALVGKKELMKLGSIDNPGAERTFLISTTHGAEMAGMGAFIETVNVYKSKNVIDHLWKFGDQLFNGINAISKQIGIEEYFYMEGGYVSMNYVTKDQDGTLSLAFRTLFSQEMINNGVLIPWIAPSLAHGEVELAQTLNAVGKSLLVYKKALADGIEKYLIGPSIKPVFRQFN